MSSASQFADEYFASINPLAKKILQDQENIRKAYGAKWDAFSQRQEEDLIDKYLIDPEIREKYKSDTSEEEKECFPKLKLLSGEKIVVDFDNNDGWTWRDEHSAPFSWETRSQNELSLFDEEDEANCAHGTLEKIDNKQQDAKEPPKRPKRTKKSRSPERDTNLAFRPEKSIWDSPFLTADRGLDSGYPSSHSSDHSKGSEETEDLLNKLGLNLTFGGDQSAPNSPFIAHGQGKVHLLEADSRSESPVLDRKRSESPSTISQNSHTSADVNKKTKKGSSDKLWKPTRRKKASSGSEPTPTVVEQPRDSVAEEPPVIVELSGVYFEEPGESSDYTVKVAESSLSTFCSEPPGDLSIDRGATADPEPEVTAGQVNPALDDSHDSDVLDNWTLDIMSKNGTQDGDSDLPKSGFDFLDNW